MSQWDIYINYKKECLIIGRTRYTISEVSEQLGVSVVQILQYIHSSIYLEKHIYKQKEILIDDAGLDYLIRKMKPKELSKHQQVSVAISEEINNLVDENKRLKTTIKILEDQNNKLQQNIFNRLRKESNDN